MPANPQSKALADIPAAASRRRTSGEDARCFRRTSAGTAAAGARSAVPRRRPADQGRESCQLARQAHRAQVVPFPRNSPGVGTQPRPLRRVPQQVHRLPRQPGRVEESDEPTRLPVRDRLRAAAPFLSPRSPLPPSSPPADSTTARTGTSGRRGPSRPAGARRTAGAGSCRQSGPGGGRSGPGPCQGRSPSTSASRPAAARSSRRRPPR